MILDFFNKFCRFTISLFIFLFFFITILNAQQEEIIRISEDVMSWTIPNHEPWPDGKYSSLKEAIIDNKFYIPVVFRGGIFPKTDFSFNIDSALLKGYKSSVNDFFNKNNKPLFSKYYFKKNLDDLIYKEVFLKNPKHFKYMLDQLPETTIKIVSIESPAIYVNSETKNTVTIPETIDYIKFIPNRKYWTSSFSADIKFSQNKSSSNWYKGEINNINIYTNTITSYNYSKDKVSLTNTLSTTYTIINAPSDSLRKYTTGNDELRFRSNFGLKAIKKWNYSSSAEFVTSMGNKYVANSNTKNSSFLSPYTINAGFGMTYAVKPKFKVQDRSLDLSLSIEPLSFKYMYSKDRKINLSAYFPKDETGNYKYFLRTFGSTITMTKTTKFNKAVNWYSRVYYFTNYERVIGEFENKLDIAMSRFFSTTIYLYLRYDDGVSKSKNSDSYLQVNEMFSFGFSYKW